MRIAVLGAGRVGRTLGQRWRAAGHEVVYGVRDPDDPRHAGLETASPPQAVRDASVVLLTLPWPAVEEVVRAVDLAGGTVVDATNPLGAAGEQSGAELVARWAPQAHVVKAFNIVGRETMAETGYAGGTPLMLVAGDDEDAKGVVLRLAEELGFDAVDAGPLVAARELEALAALWIRLSRTGQGREIAFALLRR